MTRDVSRPAARSASPTFSPLYRQIKDFLIRSLEQGEWGPGDAIPSEGELAARFNVSQGTGAQGYRRDGCGKHAGASSGKGDVCCHAHDDPRSFYRFLRLVPDGGKAMPTVSDPFYCDTVASSPEVAGVLGLKAGERVVHVKRLLRFDGEPVVFDEIFLVADLFDGLTLERLRGGERSLYSLFESDFGVRMINADEHLRAVAADEQSAGLLGVKPGDPLLLVERTAYTYGNKPVEWRRGLYCTRQALLS